ncbi:unnamed protein product [Prorocentrum cordatum]|uniref:Uncharacterized protein n=1 Tax=Prorocentrum cordatum TaxID=2364126 RepID=A0ABN9PV96_9DINO|nr:unnamed protein product [Polarella glacialis]
MPEAGTYSGSPRGGCRGDHTAQQVRRRRPGRPHCSTQNEYPTIGRLGKTLRRQPVSNRSGPAARRQQRFRRGRRPGASASGREDSDAGKGNGKNWHNAKQHMLAKTEGEEEEEEEETRGGGREAGGRGRNGGLYGIGERVAGVLRSRRVESMASTARHNKGTHSACLVQACRCATIKEKDRRTRQSGFSPGIPVRCCCPVGRLTRNNRKNIKKTGELDSQASRRASRFAAAALSVA